MAIDAYRQNDGRGPTEQNQTQAQQFADASGRPHWLVRDPQTGKWNVFPSGAELEPLLSRYEWKEALSVAPTLK